MQRALRGDLTAAHAHFGAALSSNDSYLPAALGRADALWAMDKQDEADSRYHEIIEHYPASMVPARARERAGQAVASR